MVRELTAENFDEEVLKSKLPVLVDFWADWCGPCKSIAPILEGLSEEYKDKIKFCKLNIEEYPELSFRYGIISIPTLIIFSGGRPVDQLVGLQGKSQLRVKLESVLKVAK